MEAQKSEKIASFQYSWICTWVRKFSQSRRGYLSLALNMLPSKRKIQEITKGGIFQSRFSQSDEKYNEIALMKILEQFGTL